MDVVLRGMVEPAVNIYDLTPQVIIHNGEEVTLTLDQYVSSPLAQLYVRNGLLQQLSGPSILPRTILNTDIDPQTFNLRNRSVKFDNLDADLQDLIADAQGGFFWLTDPGFSTNPSRVISFNSASLKYRQQVYNLSAGSIGPATQDSLIIGTFDFILFTLVLSLQPLTYSKTSNQEIIGSYIYSTNSVSIQGGVSIQAVNVSYDNSISMIPAINAQSAIDYLSSYVSGFSDLGTNQSSWSINKLRAVNATVSLFLRRNLLTGDPMIQWDEASQKLIIQSQVPNAGIHIESSGALSTTEVWAGNNLDLRGTLGSASLSGGTQAYVSGPTGNLNIASGLVSLNSSSVPINVVSSASSVTLSGFTGATVTTGQILNLVGGAGISTNFGTGDLGITGSGNITISNGGVSTINSTGGVSLVTPYLGITANVSGTSIIDGVGNNLQIQTGLGKNLSISSGSNLYLNTSGGVIFINSAILPSIDNAYDLGSLANRFRKIYAYEIDIPGGVLKADGSVAMTGNLSMGGNKITNGGTPSAPNDFTTVSWVQNFLNGYVFKAPVRLATTASGTLATDFANGQMIDTKTLVTNDRILIKDQINPIENGIYTVNVSGAPTRATDSSLPGELAGGMTVFVEDGFINLDTGWVVTANGSLTPGTDPITFGQIFGPGAVIAGNGLGQSGNTLFVNVASAGGIQIVSDELAIKLDGTTLQTSSLGVSVNQAALSLASIGGTLTAAKGGTGIDSSALTGFVKIVSGVWSATSISTSDVSEGTNLYYTDTRVESKVNSLLVAGTGINNVYDGILHTITQSVVGNTTVQKINVLKATTLIGTRQTLNFVEGSNISLTVADNAGSDRVDITIAATGVGEVNTASNVNSSGVGVFKQKTGVNLEFRGVDVGSSKVTANLNATNNTIEVDVVEANLTLNNIGGTLGATKGGTGLSSFTTGDLIVAASGTTLASLPDVAAGNVLLSGGVGGSPAYGKVNLTTHITGTLPIGNGGTGQTTASAAFGALSPLTTKGDILAFDTANNRLPIGANATVLMADSTQTLGIKWGATSLIDHNTLANLTTGDPHTQYLYLSGRTGGQVLVSNDTGTTTFTIKMAVSQIVGLPFSITNSGGGSVFSVDPNGHISANRIHFTGLQGGVLSSSSTPVTLTSTRFVVLQDATSGAATINLISAANTGQIYFIQKTDSSANAVSIVPNGSETINGAASKNLTKQFEYVMLVANGSTDYRVMASGIDSGPTQHNLLSSSHGDTVAASPVQGDLIIANSTPAWTKLAIGVANRVLRSNGTSPSWAQVALATDVSGTLPVGNGGTGLTSYAIGDIVYASGATTLASLADVATGNVIISGGVGVAPTYGKVGLTTHITGTLAIGNGGTGQTTAALAFGALSPLTTKGDILTFTTANARLAVGASNDMALVVDSTTASGVAWKALDTTVGFVKGPASATDTALAIFSGTTGKLIAVAPVTMGFDLANVTFTALGGRGLNFSTTSSMNYQAQGDVVFIAGVSPGSGNMYFQVGSNTGMAISSDLIDVFFPHRFNAVAAPSTPASGTLCVYQKTAEDNILRFKGSDGNERAFQTTFEKCWYADQFEDVDADWGVSALPTFAKGAVSGNLFEVEFAEATEQGVGISFRAPTWASRATFKWMHHGLTSPGGSPLAVQPSYYVRTLTSGSAWSAWSAVANFTAVTIPASGTNWQMVEQTITFATLGITAGQEAQVTITRRGSQAGDTYTGVWGLRRLCVEFS